MRLLLLAGLLLIAACGTPERDPERLVLYTGRSESLVQPLLERFTAQTGIEIDVRYGETAQLAVALAEEGVQTRADVFWAQDAGPLAALTQQGLLAELPDSLLQRVEQARRSPAGTWIATSLRARTLVYHTERGSGTVPTSILDLTQPAYRNRVGWAPTNASFQAQVSALRAHIGEEATREWLVAMRQNGARAYPRNGAIVQAVADGEITYGLVNHYYLLRMRAENPSIPVAQALFAQNDPGNLLNAAGIALLAPHAAGNESAFRFIAFLLSDEAQAFFARETAEYPVRGTAAPAGVDLPLDRVRATAPDTPLEALGDLDGTLTLLRSVGLL